MSRAKRPKQQTSQPRSLLVITMLQCKTRPAARFCSGQGFGIATGGARQCPRPDTLSPHCTGGGGGGGTVSWNIRPGHCLTKVVELNAGCRESSRQTNLTLTLVRTRSNMLGNKQRKTEKLHRCYSKLDAAVALRRFFVWSCIPLWAGEVLNTGRSSCPETTDTIQSDSVFSHRVCSQHAACTRA